MAVHLLCKKCSNKLFREKENYTIEKLESTLKRRISKSIIKITFSYF